MAKRINSSSGANDLGATVARLKAAKAARDEELRRQGEGERAEGERKAEALRAEGAAIAQAWLATADVDKVEAVASTQGQRRLYPNTLDWERAAVAAIGRDFAAATFKDRPRLVLHGFVAAVAAVWAQVEPPPITPEEVIYQEKGRRAQEDAEASARSLDGMEAASRAQRPY